MSDALLTAAQVAQLLNLNVETVYALVRRDGLPAIKIGGQWRFQRERIERWLETRYSSSEAPPQPG